MLNTLDRPTNSFNPTNPIHRCLYAPPFRGINRSDCSGVSSFHQTNGPISNNSLYVGHVNRSDPRLISIANRDTHCWKRGFSDVYSFRIPLGSEFSTQRLNIEARRLSRVSPRPSASFPRGRPIKITRNCFGR